MGSFGLWFSENWMIVVSLLLSGVAILFTALRDFILPYIVKPELKISYSSNLPYKRQAVLTGSRFCIFDRFKVENIGRATAKNCRCQIYQIVGSKGADKDLQGFPLRWANWPDMIGGFEKGERTNIGRGESEFVDLVYMRSDDTTKVFLSSYDKSIIGKGDNLEIWDYTFHIIISGDNFKPYIASFHIEKMPKFDGFKLKLLDVRRK